jgi:hypothetical protein
MKPGPPPCDMAAMAGIDVRDRANQTAMVVAGSRKSPRRRGVAAGLGGAKRSYLAAGTSFVSASSSSTSRAIRATSAR